MSSAGNCSLQHARCTTNDARSPNPAILPFATRRLYEGSGYSVVPAWQDPEWLASAERGRVGPQRRVLMIKQLGAAGGADKVDTVLTGAAAVEAASS